ncbi:Protein required for ethanol metabolism [Thoreauomyces humboldtii]|nr:Protein required for ethanol metabolism [Thoreauomyces humboldtii]
MSAIARWYHSTLTTSPIATQAVSAGILFATGDGIAQHVVAKTPLVDHDWPRTARLTFYGTFILGPGIAYWYRFLNRRIHLSTPLTTTVARVIVDQVVFAPVNMLCFFTVQTLLEGGSVRDARKKISSTFRDAYIANLMLWPGVQMVNFGFVPVNYQSLVVNVVATGWNAYLSLANARA